MGDHNYLTALSHGILAGTGIICVVRHSTPMAFVCYGAIITNSALGLWRWGYKGASDGVKGLYNKSAVVQEVICLGAVAAELWQTSPLSPDIWYLHILVPLIPIGLYFSDKDYKPAAKIIMIFNGACMAYVAITTNNWWGLGSAGSFLIAYLVVKEQISNNIPLIDSLNYQLCMFNIFSYWTLTY